MGKVIFWLVVVFAVLFALRLFNSAKLRNRRDSESGHANSRTPPATPMIRCVECGVFLPAPDAATTPDGYRCGDPACPNRKRTSV